MVLAAPSTLTAGTTHRTNSKPRLQASRQSCITLLMQGRNRRIGLANRDLGPSQARRLWRFWGTVRVVLDY
jgi:hypothetical protein